MKHRIFTIAAALMCSGMSSSYAQNRDEANKNAEMITVGVGGTFGKPKIMPKLEKIGLAQITVNYKLTTTEKTIGKEKSSGKIAGAKVTAYMETTDGELTPADFQEITDNFYHYFQRRLKESGVDTLAWSVIAGTDFYKSADDRKESNEQEKGSGQVWVTCNANNGNTLHKGNIGFAFGKIKKATNFSDDIGAPAGLFHLTVDFADLAVNVDIKSGSHTGYYGVTKTTNTKYSSAVKPAMKVIPTGTDATMLWNAKSQSETIVLGGDIESDFVYHTSISNDRSRLKTNYFGFAKSMDPVVIETTKEKYKTAAGKALEKYADAFVAKAMQMKKD